MKRRIASLILAGAGALLLVISAPAAFAATSGAHFKSASATVQSNPNLAHFGALLLSWDEAGVGNQDVSYTLSGFSQSAVYACYNRGGNHPQAANKEGPTPVSVEQVGTFSPTNGRITEKDVVISGTPLPNTTLSCPSGQTLRLVQVTYEFSTLNDTVNMVSIAVTPPGCVSFDSKNFPC